MILMIVRTTINIQDQALELCKRKAAETGRPLGDVVSAAILEAYTGRPASRKRSRFDLPVGGEGGLMPGVDLDNSTTLEDIMEGRD